MLGDKTKIVLIDIESFPNIGYTWGKYEQDVIKFVKQRMVCCVAWQWYPEKKIHVKALPDFPGYDPRKWDNSKLMAFIKSEILDKCDIAIGHNIDEFDDKMLYADLLRRGHKPPKPHRTIDTRKVLKRYFSLNSNKLDDVCQELGIGKKVKHPGFPLWEGCMSGDKKSWGLMRKYNKGDIDPLLRGLYERLRPWIVNHVPVNAIENRPGCPKCGASPVEMVVTKWRIVGSQRRPQFACRSCGGYSTGIPIKEKGKQIGWKFR